MSIIAIDAGGTWIKAARCHSDATLEHAIKTPSGAGESREAYFDSIAHAVSELKTTRDETAIGIAIPGMVTADGTTIRYTANVKGLTAADEPITLHDALARRLGVDNLIAENDAGCAALAEWGQGIGQANPDTSLLHITWGTGIGTAYVSNGKSHYGWEGGHLPLAFGAARTEAAETCNCGSPYDLEALVAVPHLIARAHRFWREKTYPTTLPATAFTDTKETSIKLLNHAETGDELANHVIDEALMWLARGIQAMAVITYPDVITLGGAMMSRDWLLDRLRQAIEIENKASGYLQDAATPDKIHRAQLGNDAGMIGAGLLAAATFK